MWHAASCNQLQKAQRHEDRLPENVLEMSCFGFVLVTSNILREMRRERM